MFGINFEMQFEETIYEADHVGSVVTLV